MADVYLCGQEGHEPGDVIVRPTGPCVIVAVTPATGGGGHRPQPPKRVLEGTTRCAIPLACSARPVALAETAALVQHRVEVLGGSAAVASKHTAHTRLQVTCRSTRHDPDRDLLLLLLHLI